MGWDRMGWEGGCIGFLTLQYSQGPVCSLRRLIFVSIDFSETIKPPKITISSGDI